MAKIGFTGTQFGLTKKQHQVLGGLLDVANRAIQSVFHHGSCIGADTTAHKIAEKIGLRIVVHPPLNESKMTKLAGDEVRPAKDYLDRNHDIVDETDWLIACPKTKAEEQRSGTWATVRYAKKKGKQIMIIYPDGGVEVK